MMMLLRQLGVDKWNEVTVQNLEEWIQKVHKMSKQQFKTHVLFSPTEMEQDLKKLKHQNVYKSRLDAMMQKGALKKIKS